ncbi:TraB/GumN family protein [Pseudofulvimonas gallinarii]|uniref:Uncharacterized protein YbaP (TraB family) n=1 Tax=Pseudofulvimonas gallinarii TaxID=634155 RepID=A0A4S3KS28_9GAMM|nr:TraB/GumN family protein [Pseudofulvimonas gallinarii]TCS94441.1 uncharacterized protein YbaP (TraB family) [Pseudofulvimonas gallinarii]THD11917.1 hypothetical protein B1808_14105 [Pseudofulvimonas gallinarii]
MRKRAWTLRAAGLLAGFALMGAPAAMAEITGSPPRPATTADVDMTVLDTVEVLAEGVQFGPGMWRVHRDGRSLWILGTQSPLPRRMQWHAEPVLAILEQCQALLRPPLVDTDIGMVRGMMLLPAALRVRRNPDNARLQDVLPPDLHARWLPLKARYMPRNRKVERFRPLFAAQELYARALDAIGLDRKPVASETLLRAARRLALEEIRPRITLELDAPRQILREFSGETLDDLACFELTLSRLETDLGAMRQRANAWAIGDIEALQSLPAPNHLGACAEALGNAQALAETGMADIEKKMRAAWLAAAEAALATHADTFAYLSMTTLLGENGMLQALREAGYDIVEPE